MVDEVISSAADKGHAGKPPITANELTEKSMIAHTSTSVSRHAEKLVTESLRNPQ